MTMWVIFLLLALVIGLILALLFVFMKYVRDYWHFLGVPNEKPRPMVEVVKTISKYGTTTQVQDQMEYFKKLYKKFKGSGPFCGFYYLFEPRVMVLSPELVQQILVKNFSNFNDRGHYHNRKTDPLSADLFSISGDHWKEMRLKLEPVFQKAHMHHFFESIREECEKTFLFFELQRQEYQKISPQSDVALDVKPIMHRYVLANIAKCVFGLNKAMQVKYPLEEFDAMTQYALYTHRHGNFLTSIMDRYPRFFRSLNYSTTNEKVHAYFKALLNDVIAHRNKVEAYTDDYLQLLINLMNQEYNTHETEVHNEGIGLMEHLFNELASHAFTFLRAGLEPTEQTLTYILYELARDPVMQQRVREEVNKVYEEDGETFTYEGIQSLKFMGQFISETIRLHPVVPYIMRRTLNDYLVQTNSNFLIRKDIKIVIPIHAMHNDPEIYPQPHIFNPDRFAPSNNRLRENCVWLGFGEGPRNCLGLHYAQLQMRCLVAMLLMRYEFSLDTQNVVVCCLEGVAIKIRPLHERSEYVETEGRESAVVI
ncbi:probable cytochrome P450 317a1 [Stomoxys calcitrans]|uniref:probable cytochrome P450 317a1 n=1 Tax=Stomoxys calcitrans TaxID=35570 RepID=UPI0027E30884|nr:probable cytochrome P450 317a1 [Stomoxys calcitrans]